MAEFAAEKVLVPSEEGDLPLFVQQRKNVFVFDTEMAGMEADLAEMYTPCTKQRTLVCREILVQQIQAGVR
jgi:hypothetical protein